MKFIIRDDDVNYFSKPDDIRRWYTDIFARKIPVGFAAIPFVKPSSDVYPKDIPPSDQEFPIRKNEELIGYIKQEPCIEILQHGTTHETVNGVYEYAGEIARTEALRGRQELEHAFSRNVEIFAPPHDWIDVPGIYAIEYAHMNVIRGRGAGIKNIIFRSEYAINFIRMIVFKLLHIFTGKVPAYPYVLNFGKHKELCSYRLEDPDVFEGLSYTNRKNGIFVVVVHLHYFTEEKKDRLLKLIEKAETLGAEFVSPSKAFV